MSRFDIEKFDVVQFNDKHKWFGCFGLVMEAKPGKHPRKYMIGVKVPQEGTAYIYDDGSGIDYIGVAQWVPEADDE